MARKVKPVGEEWDIFVEDMMKEMYNGLVGVADDIQKEWKISNGEKARLMKKAVHGLKKFMGYRR